MKLLFENWRKLLNEDVVDFPSEATASERYESYLMHMNSAIEQIKSLEEIFRRQDRWAEELVDIRESLEKLRDDELLKKCSEVGSAARARTNDRRNVMWTIKPPQSSSSIQMP